MASPPPGRVTRNNGKDPRRPKELAEWARAEAGVGDPQFLLVDVAEYFGLAVVVRDELDKAGQLVPDGGCLHAVVRRANREYKRFTLAHEVGHFLLDRVEGIPLAEQTNSRPIEHYCNSFASNMLIPRGWLTKHTSSRAVSLDAAVSLAAAAGCSLAAVVMALNEACSWNATLIVWRLALNGSSTWMAPSCVKATRAAMFFDSSEETSTSLSQLASGCQSLELPVVINGVKLLSRCEALREGSTIMTLHRDLRHPGASKDQARSASADGDASLFRGAPQSRER